jgi:hypothetical protein
VEGYSPTLALCTAAFEITVAVLAFRSPGSRPILRTTGGILLLLAGYQLLEVFLCGHPESSLGARLAFADVIWLPPMGVLLILELAAPTHRVLRRLVGSLFVVAAFLATWILLDPGFVRLTICQAVIATYHSASPLYTFYGAFYQLGLFAMMLGAAFGLVHCEDKGLRRHLADVQAGTIGFVVPALLLEVVRPEFSGSMPSVMCHFALVLAIFLARLVLREKRAAVGSLVPDRFSVA